MLRNETIVYHSSNGGLSWHAYTSTQTAFTPGYIVATGPNEALASSAQPDNGDESSGDSSLWKTTDGGETWTQTWPALQIGPNSLPIRLTIAVPQQH
jgi:photosystem II stability/assembly factor-like uncharacterized protein